MTIDEAVALLAGHAAKYGGATPLYFDCPHCLTSFAPTKLVAQAAHLQPEPAVPAPVKAPR